MSPANPYDCTKPAGLFVGYEHEIAHVVQGLQERKSFDLVGGRRCGKTSLLKQIKRSIRKDAGSHALLPHFIDMQGVVPKRPIDFFQALESAFTRELPVEPWRPSDSEHAYHAFLARVRKVERALAHGPDWAVVLLLDELDAAANTLGSDDCFQNLRNLLSAHQYRSRFRVCIAAGHGELVRHGSALTNVMEKLRTRLLTRPEMEHLIQVGFEKRLTSDAQERLFQLSGGHAFILQALLSSLWELRNEPVLIQHQVQQAASRFIKDQASVLQEWVRTVGSNGRAVYNQLLKSPGLSLSKSELRDRLPHEDINVSKGLEALDAHGLIDDVGDAAQITSELFRQWWILERFDKETTRAVAPVPKSPQGTEADPTCVLVVHGRHKEIHAATCAFLRALGLFPLEWSDMVQETGHAAPSAMEVLEAGFKRAKAVLVLFTPDDEVRLGPELRTQFDPDWEATVGRQPRPNVLLEAGMAMALFPRRTIFVQVGPIRPISDLAGLQFIRMDNPIESRQQLVTRLKGAGCQVNDRTSLWQTIGDFTVRPH